MEGWRAARKGQGLGTKAQRKQGNHQWLWSDKVSPQSCNRLMEACDLGGHRGEPGAGEVPIWGSDEEPTARSGILVTFSDGRVTVLQETKLSWREACDGTQRRSAFTRGDQHLPGEWRRLSPAIMGEERSQTENWEPVMKYHYG